MRGKITLEVTDGPIKGRTFTFEEHDTFIFGREDDCHAKLSAEDTTASRYHFLLEANPPDARVQDIGSRNGTYINGEKTGGRPAHRTREQTMNLDYPTVDLKDGDEIEVGRTVFKIRVEVPTVCCNCGDSIPDKHKEMCEFTRGLCVCPDCREKGEREGHRTKPPLAICNNCGKDVTAEIGKRRAGAYTCNACRTKGDGDLGDFLKNMVEQVSVTSSGKEGSIDGYELGEELGKGGMGAVYLARRKSDGETVAIKVMLAKVAVDEDACEDFKREVDSTRVLSHPNIAKLYDFNYSGNLFFFALEYCPGRSILDLMVYQRRGISWNEAGHMILAALDGLAYAHDQNLVHGDLKPQNVLLTVPEVGVVKVSDFGLVKSFEKTGLSGYTKTGEAAWTYGFMPKEQLTNFKYVKPVSDVWSMGATLYYMLTTETPRDIASGQSPVEAVMRDQVVPIRKKAPNIPKSVADVIDQALASNAKDRYQTAAEFRDELRKVL